MKYLGVDVGSRYVKLAAVSDDGETVFTGKLDTIRFYLDCRAPDGGVSIERLPLFREMEFDFGPVVSTGYGRYNVRIKGAAVVSEIKAHAVGAACQTGLSDFTLMDLGGQDTKVVRVRGGMVDDFVMNDKCAAGSGRYLENIATTLGITAEDMGKHHDDPVRLSDTCAIFGESEVIGHVAEGVPIERICAGANRSVAQRLAPLIKRFHSDIFVMTGGVAKNAAVLRFVSEACGSGVMVPEDPVFNGALGCALIASGVKPLAMKSE